MRIALRTFKRCSLFSRESISLNHQGNCTNILALDEAHFGVPMAEAELNIVNVHLNASIIAFLGHSSTTVMMVDQQYFALVDEASKIWAEKSKDTSLQSYMS